MDSVPLHSRQAAADPAGVDSHTQTHVQSVAVLQVNSMVGLAREHARGLDAALASQVGRMGAAVCTACHLVTRLLHCVAWVLL